jgi:hypothetical protein
MQHVLQAFVPGLGGAIHQRSVSKDLRAVFYSDSNVVLTPASQQCCDAPDQFVGDGSMNDTVDRVMASYENLPALEHLEREEIRVKVSQYLAKLSSAGHSGTEELAFYGLAYLRILHEGPDPRYTGC